jgi:hypothetical protein
MDFTEFERKIKQAGLTRQEFAGLMRMHPRTVYNYSKSSPDRVPDHLAVVVSLLSKMHENGIEFSSIFSDLDLQYAKPRGAKVDKRSKGD